MRLFHGQRGRRVIEGARAGRGGGERAKAAENRERTSLPGLRARNARGKIRFQRHRATRLVKDVKSARETARSIVFRYAKFVAPPLASPERISLVQEWKREFNLCFLSRTREREGERKRREGGRGGEETYRGEVRAS
jgi:hypothetical protein